MTKRINKYFLMIIIINPIFAQDRFASFSKWIKSIPEYGYSGMKNTFTQKSNLTLMGTVGLSALVAHQYEEQLQNYAQREGLLPDKLSHFGDLYGGLRAIWLLPAAIVISSKVSNETDREMLEKLEYGTVAIAANGAITILLKELIGRERPNRNSNRSMPSGHSSHSFTVATVANEIYGKEVGVVAYLMATLVAVSRINDNEHYLSDVIAGAGLGTLVGLGFAKTYRRYKYDEQADIQLSLRFNFRF